MTLSSDLTPEFLKSVDWEDPIKEVFPNTCEHFYTRLRNAASAAEEQGNATVKGAFVLLGQVSSLHLKPQEKQSPFGPMLVYEGRRSADVIDFAEDHIDALKLLLTVLNNNDLKARVADVIWTAQRKGNFGYAEQAIDFYLLAGEGQMNGETSTYAVERFTRALHLAASLGRNSSKLGEAARKIEAVIESLPPKYNLHVGQLIELLLEYKAGDITKFSNLAEICALDAEKENNWYIAAHYWEIKAKCHRIKKEPDQEYQAFQMLANTYVNTATDSLKQSRGNMVAAHHIQSAIEVLRRIPDTKEQQDQLHRTMLDYQQKSVNEMASISSGSIDLTKNIESAIATIKDKPTREAIIYLALFSNPVSRRAMVSYVDEMIEKSPLLAILTNNIVDSKGKVVGKIGSILDGSEEKVADAKESETFHWANYEQQALGTIIENTRHYFLVEHNPSIQDTLEIVKNNPFVPPGREWIFAQGLLSGLQGDYLTALHLLIPQIENSIRVLLNRSGVITSGINADGIQEEFDINRLLDMPDTAKIFHEDLMFGLKGTLTSRFGSNFRNLLAHGLLEHRHFLSYDAVYIWWLILKICCMPLLNQEEGKDAPKKD